MYLLLDGGVGDHDGEGDVSGPAFGLTGVGGMIGRVVVRRLAARVPTARMAGLVGPRSSNDLEPPDCDGAWTFGDICDANSVRPVVVGADTVIHIAGPPSVAFSYRHPAASVEAHALGTATVLQEATRAGCLRRLVLVSSAEVYGLPERPVVDECHPIDPLSPYAAAKVAAEAIARAMARTHGFELVIVRPFAVYGPDSPDWSLVGTAVRQAIELPHDAPIVMRDLSRVRDLVHVQDVADLIVTAALAPSEALTDGPFVCNAATGVPSSVADVAVAAAAAAGRHGVVTEHPQPTVTTREDVQMGARPATLDPHRLVGSPVRARNVLGWTPQWSLADGVADLLRRRRALARS